VFLLWTALFGGGVVTLQLAGPKHKAGSTLIGVANTRRWPEK